MSSSLWPVGKLAGERSPPWTRTGDTVFNHLQVDAVIDDLQKLATRTRTAHEKEALARVEKLARKSGQHLYVTFQGD